LNHKKMIQTSPLFSSYYIKVTQLKLAAMCACNSPCGRMRDWTAPQAARL
jgi:hypothetical protein